MNPGDDHFTDADLQIHPGAVAVPTVPGLPCPSGIPPVVLSDAETARIGRLAFHYRRSGWRRRHQACARWYHYSTRLAGCAT